MEKRKILYRLGGCGRDEWMYFLAKELQKHISHIPFFHCGNTGYHFIKNRVNQENILFLNSENQTQIKKPDLQYLKTAEEKFNLNVWDVWELVSQRNESKRSLPSDAVLVLYEDIIKKLDYFLDQNKITDFILTGPAASSDIIFLKIMKQKNINVIILKASPLQERFGISKDLSNHFCKLEENYWELKEKNSTEKEKEEILKIIKEYHHQKYKPNSVITYKKEPKLRKIKRYSKAGLEMLKRRTFPSRPVIKNLLFSGITQKIYNNIGLFESPKEEKFILFPLHFQPEASTLIYGKWYNNQLNLIENLIRSIPVDHKLYVKVHNFGYGHKKIKFYNEIKKYHNVRLIGPQFNNLELIQKSSLVVTITGTAGWEGIMLQKPVIVFGDTFYDIFDCVRKIKNIRELPSQIGVLLGKKINYKETFTCLSALVESTYPGLVLLPHNCGNLSLKEENIKLLAEGIRDYCSKINKWESSNNDGGDSNKNSELKQQ